MSFPLPLLQTGVPGLDALLGGGLPEYSLNFIGGAPGAGKTILAHQIMFSLARSGKKVVYFAAIGEPLLKMLRYQQVFDFFDISLVGDRIHYESLDENIMRRQMGDIVASVVERTQALKPDILVIDSFRSLMQVAQGESEITHAMQENFTELALQLAGWKVTTLLVGAYSPEEAPNNALYTIADGLIVLNQELQHSSTIPKIQVRKLRGRPHLPGLHGFRIDDSGLTIFPRLIAPEPQHWDTASAACNRLSVGVPELDMMLHGGLPVGYTMLVVGPSGSGKTVLASEFLLEGARAHETGVIATFERHLGQIREGELGRHISAGHIHVYTLRSLDLSVDATMHDLIELVHRVGARRIAFDSLSAYELALAQEYRDDFREAMYRLIATLTTHGVTVVLTTELEDRFLELQVSPYGGAFLVDAILLLRYLEVDGCLATAVSVIKLRGSEHSRDLRRFAVHADGISVGRQPIRLPGILTGRTGLAWRRPRKE